MLEPPASADYGRPQTGPDTDVRPALRVLLAAPRGFCAGVRRAIDAVRDALALHGAPVFVRRAIVHNLAVVRALEAEGARFVEEIDEVPEGGVVILSAHGVAPAVRTEARARGLIVYDAVCPLVAKIHREVERHHASGRRVLLIGHEGHPEIVGTLGHLPEGAAVLVRSAEDVASLALDDEDEIAYAIQSTFSVEEAAAVVTALEARFERLAGPQGSDICYATTNRQAAVREIAGLADAVIVAGEDFSSNARRLAEVASHAGCPSVQLVAEAAAIDWTALRAGSTIGLTAAASTPESSVAGILDALRSRYDVEIAQVATTTETTSFRRVAVPC
ncbi:4-hydroxy-3-methylbut-2-enyl diphosphate reductase [Sphingomonas parva]|uniref:4-hydroxy-3-methylbut-2-enyl diphosphate reductase n=1 Tax=Sphingomonas parva TaxID=2555898 RepID=A0A4Y8ZWB1_9SPHN|nr:4-hydroxy-3-methylbut-2-enyl diphosphate reductase [Sphingomonas parva]TFI60331.1 4-hydroxy-3-methylbut-2-enyl diphosphate reductase [Sphingomonas parva]